MASRGNLASRGMDATQGPASPTKQRGIYSDFVSSIEDVTAGPSRAGGSSRRRKPFAHTFQSKKPLHAAAVSSVSQPRKALEPKVYVPFERRAGMPPRKVEVERKKREYASKDVGEILLSMNIDTSKPDVDDSPTSFAACLPLHAFDNTDYEVRAPEAWAELASADGGVPAKALVQVSDSERRWEDCTVVGYDAAQETFAVEFSSASPLSGQVEHIHRVNLYFKAEDPSHFANRIASAHQLRSSAEAMLRYNLYIDCMPSDDTPNLDSEQVNRILGSALNTRQLKHGAVDATALLNEVNIDYMRTMNKIIFDTNMESAGESGLLSAVNVPVKASARAAPDFGVVQIPPHDFAETFSNFSFASYLTREEVIFATVKVRTECERAYQHKMLHCAAGKPLMLDEFEHIQTGTMASFASMVKDSWTTTIKNHIKTSLKDVGKGWFNLRETDSEVYEFSKLKKFLKMVNYMMQDTLRYIVMDNLNSYTEHMEVSAEGKIQVVGPNDVKIDFSASKDMGRERRQPLFLVAIGVVEQAVSVAAPESTDGHDDTAEESKHDEDAPATTDDAASSVTAPSRLFGFNTELDSFVDIAVDMIGRSLKSLKDTIQVERLVMDRLFWSHDPVMQTVYPSEMWVEALVERIDGALRSCLPAMHQYLQTYNQFLDFLNLNVNDFMEDLTKQMTEEYKLSVLKPLVAKHRRAQREVEDSIPPFINMGLFRINTAEIRSILSEKHNDIANRIQRLIGQISKQRNEKISRGYSDIMRELSRYPKNIEELTSVKEFINTVPDKVRELTKEASDVDQSYLALESMHHKLPNEEFNLRWQVFHGPKRVQEKIDEVLQMLEDEKKRYMEEMENEQTTFDEHLEALYQEVVGFNQFTDISKVDEVAAKASKIKRQLNEAGDKSRLFNNREGLFGKDITEYDKLSEINKLFDPYYTLWDTVSTWLADYDRWVNGSFLELDAEEVEKKAGIAVKNMHRSVKNFEKLNVQGCLDIATEIKGQVESFRPHIPLVIGLRNPGMRERHWQELSAVTGIEIMPDESFTLAQCFDMKLQDHIETITKVGEKAGKEYQIEAALDKMNREWEDVNLVVEPYRTTGTYILKGVDDLQQILDEHVTMTQAMTFSAFKKPFAERIDTWSETLNTVSDVLDEWIKVQRSWLYLQPIFDSADIQKQLPTEYKRFSTVDKNWRQTLSSAKSHSKAIKFCANEKLLEKFQESNKFLDLVQKGLSDYLETKRAAFARFYFLSNDELLEILSQTKDPTRVQPHLKKCFEGIKSVVFDEDMLIHTMISSEGEKVDFSEPINPNGKNVEVWMTEVENGMRASVKRVLYDAVQDYLAVPRTEWVQKWAAQTVLNGSQLHWTREIEEAVKERGAAGVEACYQQQLNQLADMVELVRGKLNKLARVTLGALTVVDVHARDVTKKLVASKLSSLRDFDWISQMRYYWDGGDALEGDMWVMMVSARRPYGYEYIGNSFRLVITPLTDKCYMTLMGALQMNLGGAPAGPAGTGKTETTKDLAKALAKQCVVFNCSDGLDYLAMGKFFKGLASCGAWACFDEFNRIDVEVLSVVAQQIITLQNGVNAGLTQIFFEDSEIKLDAQFAVFITMNPGYAGRTELPDNLKALFRPVAMMVPDYALIGEIMLFSFGFDKALICAQKMVATFKLCSEQLSSQDHYDYGMRAVKTVITAAGNLKRQDPDLNEEVLLLRALQDVNLPKFLAHDLPLFRGIISDLFPGLSRPHIDYGDLMTALTYCTEQEGLQAVDSFLTKCIQLYETIVVRHGLMVVGPTGGGKSCIIRVLRNALTMLKKANIDGDKYEKVLTYYMNPKSITMGQLYGEFDANTHEWNDGILAGMIRDSAKSTTADLKWMVFDGPVDAIWIENMNTVLDDNKKLCLVSGEIIALSDEMEIMFEVEDLAVASPATVSRCGMVYMEPTSLGLDPLIQSWIERLPTTFTHEMRATLMNLFDTYVDGAMYFLRRYLAEPVPTMDNNLLCSLYHILDCYFERYYLKEGRDDPTQEEIKKLNDQLPALFMFALIWSVAATTNKPGRRRMDAYLRTTMRQNNFPAALPDTGVVYDYCFDLESSQWVGWMTTVPEYKYDPKLSFSELIIPTKDSVRYKYLAKQLLINRKHVMMTGPTGTGKTVNITEMLSYEMPDEFIPIAITFSAQTSANQTQDSMDSKMEKRQRGVYGPTAGMRYILFVDDLNMPQREEYFAQPPIELLRQWCDYEGWYDRKERTWRRIVDTTLLTAMGPPGGGRNPVTPRFIRHFNVINYTEMDDDSMQLIFGTILGNFLSTFDPAIAATTDSIVAATVEVYNTIATELLPTPRKPHYTFNLRDLGKVFQGMLMADSKKIGSDTEFVRMWVHEARRVFMDRLINDEDRTWFNEQLKKQATERFGKSWDEVMTNERCLFGDYMVPGADPKIYCEVKDMKQLVPTIEEYLSDYNAESKTPMKLVMFLDAIEHVSRISRVIRQPQGNALLLGVGGSGRQSLTRLATFMADYDLFQIEISKGYGKNEWREDLKQVLLKAGIEEKPAVFLFNDSQVIFEGMLEDVNNVLNSGDVPNLYAVEDMETIMNTCRRDCLAKRITPTKINIYAQYILRVRRNIHVVMCMSPMSNMFNNRLRMFPALVNCCTIDWFSEWPPEALRSVALSALTETDLKLGDHVEGCVEFFKLVHTSVADTSIDYFDTMRRYNYVTPTSYLELLTTFKKVLEQKRDEVGTLRNRLQTGLDKLISTSEQVAALQIELRDMEPQLLATQKEVDEMIIKIDEDKKDAAETKAVVEKEEAEAQKLASETRAIAEDAERDLAEALPALDAAVACLNKLKRSDLDEVRAMKKPPAGVKLTMHATCIMFGIKPVLKNDPDNIGKKIKDYWEAAQKNLLNDANKLLSDLKNYDKENIPEKVIAEISPFMEMPEFEPSAVDKSSQACSGICMWVRAMHKYYHVAKQVEPKKKKLAEAQATLDKTMGQLNEAKARLKAVEDKIADLEMKFNQSQAKKEQLVKDVETCRARLERAQKLIGGLGGEKDRWTSTVAKLNGDYTRLIGDALVSSSTVAYLGAFTSDYRHRLVDQWQAALRRLELPHTEGCDVHQTLADPVQVRAWNIAGLPSDTHSIENGIIMAKARRWPLLIDPQGQANRYIRNMGNDSSMAENGIDIIRQSQKKFLQGLENGVRFGRWVLLENIGESLDAALEPVLLQQKFKQGGADMIKLGDNVIPYNDSFRFFLTTKLPNPHYPPEVAVKVSLLNFTITPKGLEDQMLGVFVVTELPELEERKNTLVLANARMRKELKELEDKILYMLSNSKGNILDDEELIETLAQSKVKSAEITEKVKEAEETEKEIDATREKYRPVANRASILYFCITDLSSVDPMYQYSLPWFTALFRNGIMNSEPADEISQRITNLNNFFTFLMYRNVCRSLFERHKLLFSFMMTVKVLQGAGIIDNEEWRFLISAQAPGVKTAENPNPEWINDRIWTEFCTIATLPAFKDIETRFAGEEAGWRAIFDSADAHREPLPPSWEKQDMTPLQRMCLLRCIRPDRISMAVQDFVIHYLGQKFIEPPPFDLNSCYEDSTVITPLIFVLSTGSDPTRAFYTFAEQVGMRSKVESISLGQGQGKIAAKMIEEALVKGSWVLLQNCHLAASWMSDLERICENIDPDKVGKDFRLWLTSMPSKAFPVSVLQNGVKMTNEPPKGLKQNIRNFYWQLNDEELSKTSKPDAFRKLLFGLAFFHANVQERKKFGPLGWNVPYEYNNSDLEISKRQLELFLDEYDHVPYQVLNFLTSYINYGGRVTDDKDLRTIDVILKDYFTPGIMKKGYKFSASGLYHTIGVDEDAPHASYMEYIDSLPLHADPEVFGMHSNANIACDQNETYGMFDILISLQPRTAATGGKTSEERMAESAQSILERLPPSFDVESITMQYPVKYEESMNTVLVQECIRYNKLLAVMKKTLADIQKAIKGLVVMSSELEDMGNSLDSQRVPVMWEACAYPSMKPLAAWVNELVERLDFIGNWVEHGTPACFWISGFFFPQAFLTGTLQNYARKYQLPIDTLSFSFNVLDTEGLGKPDGSGITERPEDGCYIRGLFLEGARWDGETKVIAESRPKQLYTALPVMHLLPVKNRPAPTTGVYRCPVYKILSRHGTLSTTGHSTNFVMFIELPSDKPDIINNVGQVDTDHWIKAGVAAFCSLRY